MSSNAGSYLDPSFADLFCLQPFITTTPPKKTRLKSRLPLTMDIHPLIDTIHITVSHWRRWIPIALSTRDCVKELDYPDPDTHWRPSLLNIYKTFVDFTQAATPSQPWPIPACVKLNKLDVLRMFCGNPKCSPYQHVHLQFNNKNYTVTNTPSCNAFNANAQEYLHRPPSLCLPCCT